LRLRKDVAENEELVEEGVRQEEADIEEQRPSRTSGAATRTSTMRRGATVATA
jgi:hypothetical protein